MSRNSRQVHHLATIRVIPYGKVRFPEPQRGSNSFQALSLRNTPLAAYLPERSLHWLQRYVSYHSVKVTPGLPIATAIRAQFTTPAWRLLCRSPKSAFKPVIQNKNLTFSDLVAYAQALVKHGFQVAPPERLLSHFIRSSYMFYDGQPAAPHLPADMRLLRLAARHESVSLKEMQLVHEWVNSGNPVTARMTWRSVVVKAKAAHLRRRCLSAFDQRSFAFACEAMDWEHFRLIPLVSPHDLWDEGEAMSTCLYRLRSECEQTNPSRFFSVLKSGKRYATLELAVTGPRWEGLAQLKEWKLRDCRLSYNRIPPQEVVASLMRFAVEYQRLSLQQGWSVKKGVSAWEGIPAWAWGQNAANIHCAALSA